MCSASKLGLKYFFPSLCWMIIKGTCSSFSPKYCQDKPYSMSNIDIECYIFWMLHILIQTWKAPWLDSTSPTRKLTPCCLNFSAASRYFDLKDSALSAVKLMNNIACQYQQFKFLEHRIKWVYNQNKGNNKYYGTGRVGERKLVYENDILFRLQKEKSC